MPNPLSLLARVLDVVEIGVRVVDAVAKAARRRRPEPPPSPDTQRWLTQHYWTREALNEPPPRCIWCGELKSAASSVCPGSVSGRPFQS